MEDLKRDGRNWYPFSEARAFVRVLELKNRDEWRAETRRSGLYALGDPHPTYQPLGWGEAEAHTLAKLAHNLGMPAEVKVQEQATRSWLIRVLEQGNIVDASCHGAFVSNDFLRSRLLLAREEYLTLAEMLSREVNLRGLRLLILSACQTAVLDLLGAVDEVHSLAVGAVQARTTSSGTGTSTTLATNCDESGVAGVVRNRFSKADGGGAARSRVVKARPGHVDRGGA